MSEQDNINIARKIIDGFNSHNLDVTVQYLADSVRTMDPTIQEVQNKEQTRMYNKRYLDAVPDLHFDLKDVIAQGDKVALSWIARGTNNGPLQFPTGDTLPATHKSVQLPGVTILEIRNGMVVRQDIFWDQVSFMTQLGLVTQEQLFTSARR